MNFDGIMLNEHHANPFCLGAVMDVEASVLAKTTVYGACCGHASGVEPAQKTQVWHVSCPSPTDDVIGSPDQLRIRKYRT